MGWEQIFTITFLVAVLGSAFRLSTPLLFSSLGEIITEKSGVLNLGVEGMMLVGASVGFSVAFLFGNLWIGIVAALLVGGALGLLMAMASISLKANQVIAGMAIWFIGLGLSTMLFWGFFGRPELPPTIEGFRPISIPLLHNIPIVGSILFKQTILTYLALLLVPLCAILLYRTSFGLKMRAVGENPRAADTLGINVSRIRYLCVIIGGMLAGLGGAALSLGYLNTFYHGMTGGKGFIAIAIVYFAKWRPHLALAGALLFGGLDTFQVMLQGIGVGISPYVLKMIPYLLTIVVLVGIGRKAEAPAALTIPYER